MKIRELLELNRDTDFFPGAAVTKGLPSGGYMVIGRAWTISNAVLDTEIQIIGDTKAHVDDRKRNTNTG